MILPRLFCLGSLVSGVTLGAIAIPAVALTDALADQSGSTLIAQSFKPPQTQGATSTAGGATRGVGTCDSLAAPVRIVPLMPSVKAAGRDPELFSLTLAERPTLFWYLESPAPAVSAKFLLVKGSESLGKQRQIVHEATLQLPETAGIVSLPWPEASPALEVGAQYQWYLSFSCDPAATEPDSQLSGWLLRRSPQESLSASKLSDLDTAKAESDLRTQAQIFAESGIWQDALMAMVQLRQEAASSPGQSRSPNFEQEWERFLASAGLESVSASPLVEQPVVEVSALMSVR